MMATSAPQPSKLGPVVEIAVKIVIAAILMVIAAYVAVKQFDVPLTWEALVIIGVGVGLLSPFIAGAMKLGDDQDTSHRA